MIQNVRITHIIIMSINCYRRICKIKFCFFDSFFQVTILFYELYSNVYQKLRIKKQYQSVVYVVESVNHKINKQHFVLTV